MLSYIGARPAQPKSRGQQAVWPNATTARTTSEQHPHAGPSHINPQHRTPEGAGKDAVRTASGPGHPRACPDNGPACQDQDSRKMSGHAAGRGQGHEMKTPKLQRNAAETARALLVPPVYPLINGEYNRHHVGTASKAALHSPTHPPWSHHGAPLTRVKGLRTSVQIPVGHGLGKPRVRSGKWKGKASARLKARYVSCKDPRSRQCCADSRRRAGTRRKRVRKHVGRRP